LIKMDAWHVGMLLGRTLSRVKLFILGGVLALGWAGCQSTTPQGMDPAATTEAEAAALHPVKTVQAMVEGGEVRTETVVPGQSVQRHGDEMVVAGQFFRTGTPVVLWMDEGGYDGYRIERRFSGLDRAGWAATQEDGVGLSSPNRYGMRAAVLTRAEQERVRGGGWDLPTLQRVVDQFVLHYDASGTSAQCFKRLHDDRGLSIHFMLDLDGTIYQTLDLKERAWHATVANSRSIGIEIANIGAYPTATAKPFETWYKSDEAGHPRLHIPTGAELGQLEMAKFSGRPDRAELVEGKINGGTFFQYDLTPEQYAALIKLTAALCAVFPNMPCDYPRNEAGELLNETLTPAALKTFQGLLGHYHIQTNKIDPGPAFQWERVIEGARALLEPALKTEVGVPLDASETVP
jgi:N-acetylmuramoyl-L-alanine amidase